MKFPNAHVIFRVAFRFAYALIFIFFWAAFLCYMSCIVDLHIDISSLRTKETVRLGPVIIYEKEKDNRFSTMLRDHHIPLSPPEWRMDTSYFYFGAHISPHYQYHGVVGGLRSFDIICHNYYIQENNQLIIAQKYLDWFDKMENAQREPDPLDMIIDFNSKNKVYPLDEEGSEKLNEFISTGFGR